MSVLNNLMEAQDSHSEHEGSAAGNALVKKAAAAMAVGVGSFKDPDHLQVHWYCLGIFAVVV